jgi:nucleotide-binding universal stress UspA family protein
MPASVIIGYDGTERGDDALVLGAALAGALGAPVEVVAAFPLTPRSSRISTTVRADTSSRGEAESWLVRARERMDSQTGAEFTALPAPSAPRALHFLAEERKAAAVVVGSSHRGRIGRVLPGGTAERLLHGSPCPVAVAPLGYREHEDPGFRVIGVAYDGGKDARAALTVARGIAEATGAELDVVAVLDPTPASYEEPGFAMDEHLTTVRTAAREELDAVAAEHERGAGVRLLEGAPHERLVEASREMDLLVMGSRGYGPGRSVLLGATSRRVVAEAACPVLVVPRQHERGQIDASGSFAIA